MDGYKTPNKPVRMAKQTIRIPPSPMMRKIGYGTGVAVYQMNRSPISNVQQSPWALKKLTRRTAMLEERLKDEVVTLRKLKHPNVVGFRAHIRLQDGSTCLAMEECSTCLGQLIEQRCEENPICYPAKEVLKVCSDVARALKYLHNEALILHCDVKSYNVLIKGDFEICKLCDFGTCLPLTKDGSVDLDKAGVDVEFVGTAPWCPPEVLRAVQVITVKADVYAYGLVIWEMLALTPPPVPDDGDMDCSVEDEEEPPLLVKRPDLPDCDFGEDYNLVLELFYLCTDVDYNKRPTSKDLCFILSGMKDED